MIPKKHSLKLPGTPKSSNKIDNAEIILKLDKAQILKKITSSQLAMILEKCKQPINIDFSSNQFQLEDSQWLSEATDSFKTYEKTKRN